ncbi:MAG: hypothetical protein HY720_16755 [Planctomycetes bacterium]|nr:hypothetical protein [Planctomycetota bacterium]
MRPSLLALGMLSIGLSAAAQGMDWRADYEEAAREAARTERPLFVVIAWAKDGA